MSNFNSIILDTTRHDDDSLTMTKNGIVIHGDECGYYAAADVHRVNRGELEDVVYEPTEEAVWIRVMGLSTTQAEYYYRIYK